MFSGVLIALLLGQSAIAEPTSEQAIESLAAATGCAVAFTETTSLARERIEAIPREALENCSQAEYSAAENLVAAMPEHDFEIARDWVSAKMRVAAANALIVRLERGEYVGLPAPDDVRRQLVNPGARLIYCMRVALGREMEGIFFGSDWPLNMRGQSREQISAAFIEIAQRSCPASEAAYVTALEQVMRGADRPTRDALAANLAPSEIHAIAVGSYVDVVPTR